MVLASFYLVLDGRGASNFSILEGLPSLGLQMSCVLIELDFLMRNCFKNIITRK